MPMSCSRPATKASSTGASLHLDGEPARGEGDRDRVPPQLALLQPVARQRAAEQARRVAGDGEALDGREAEHHDRLGHRGHPARVAVERRVGQLEDVGREALVAQDHLRELPHGHVLVVAGGDDLRDARRHRRELGHRGGDLRGGETGDQVPWGSPVRRSEPARPARGVGVARAPRRGARRRGRSTPRRAPAGRRSPRGASSSRPSPGRGAAGRTRRSRRGGA